MRVQSERVEELLESMIGQFDADEADHDCVSVEQAPNKDNILKWTKATCNVEDNLMSFNLFTIVRY